MNMPRTVVRRRGIIASAAAAWRYRELLICLVARNLKAKYKRSALGFIWTLLNPLLTVAVLTVVFSYVVRIQLHHYWAFLLSGYFAWNFTQQTIFSATYVLAEHAQLSRSISYPKELLVLAAACSRLVEFFLEISLVLIALCVFHHHRVPVGYVFVPWLILIQLLISLGVMLPLATLAVFYQDVQHGLPILMTTLFYITPIFYPLAMVDGRIRQFYLVNPFAGVMTLYHQTLYYGEIPSLSLCITMSVVGLVLTAIGYSIFNRFKDMYAEIV